MKRISFLIIGLLLFCSMLQAAKTTIDINKSFCRDTILRVFNVAMPINSASINISVSGTTSASFFRILLVDDKDRRYLLAESYREISINNNAPQSYADETDNLDNITPVRLELYVKDITLNILSLELISGLTNSTKTTRLQTNKIQEKVNRINSYNNSHEKLWTAGVTELSLLPFEERMRALGFSVSDDTGGFEYYVGGIFEVGERDEYVQSPTRDTSFVDEFDWTNRHGKNWMTSIKGQGYSNFCAAFAAAACVEALVNLYYNQKIDLDLSELELGCCSHIVPNRNPYKKGLFLSWVCNYLETSGVCDEYSYPFLDDPNDTLCRSDLINPQYTVKTGGYEDLSQYHNEDSIKKFLINYGPLLSGFWVSHDPANGNERRSHAMALVGFGTIHAGDSIREITGTGSNSAITMYYVIPENSPLIGRTYFKFKNSNNIRINDDVDGYMHLMFNNLSQLDSSIRLLYPFVVTDCQTGLPMYTDNDVVCEDTDGDGYYFWGLGPKPTNSPIGVPDEPDGDDSDPSVGPMDAYGNLTVLTNEIIISNLVDYCSVINPSHNIRILNGGHLRISNSTTLCNSAQITVDNGGVLTINGGTLNEARIILCAGSTLNIQNSGNINMAAGEDFSAPVGASVNINRGKIN